MAGQRKVGNVGGQEWFIGMVENGGGQCWWARVGNVGVARVGNVGGQESWARMVGKDSGKTGKGWLLRYAMCSQPQSGGHYYLVSPLLSAPRCSMDHSPGILWLCAH